MALPYPTIIPGLRSPSEKVGTLLYFGRMLDKIRLAAAGQLPEEWHASLGTTRPLAFDAYCCRFLRLRYDDLVQETLAGGRSDQELLDWAFAIGRQPDAEEIEIWNTFMSKRGWRDDGTQRLHERLAELGLPPGTVLTMFEFIDLDEGRLSLEGAAQS